MNANASPSVRRCWRSASEVTAAERGLSRIAARRPPQNAGDSRNMVVVVGNFVPAINSVTHHYRVQRAVHPWNRYHPRTTNVASDANDAAAAAMIAGCEL